MIGQERLIKQFNNFTIDTLPHTIMLIGKYGSGKHTFCNYIAQQYKLNLYEITDKIDYNLIDTINNFIEPTLCVIDGSDITLKEEAVLLKFLEEPRKNIFNIILCESTANMLATITNRCQAFNIGNYTKEDLQKFYTLGDINKFNDLIKIADTPGKIIQYENVNINRLLELSRNIFNLAYTTGVPFLVHALTEINFTEEKTDKLPYKAFADALLYTSLECIKGSTKKYYTYYYKLTNNLVNDLSNKYLNKLYLFENYLLNLKGIDINEGV